MIDQQVVFLVLGAMLVAFVFGRWRYDVVALAALLLLAVVGIVPGEEAFLGFGHPAIVTVAAILVVSRGLRNCGVVDVLASWMARIGKRPTVLVGAMTLLVAVCSSFMNNVGALALLMPVGLRLSRQNEVPPSLLLMPMAFGSILGGMTTLIGTPPNIIIATYRGTVSGTPFGMFDFSPVGVGVALSGVAFIALGGWRLIPRRKGQRSREDLFQVEDYITEVRLPEDSLLVGKSLRTLGSITKAEAVVLSVIRNARKELVPSTFMRLCAGDILMVEASSADLERLVQDARLELVAKEDGKEEKKVGEKENGKEQDDRSAEVGLGEAIILPNSMYVGWTANSLNLRHRYGINLLAVARKGERLKSRLNQIRFKAGDILLVQGEEERRQEAESALGWLPLAERGLRLGEPRRLLLGTCIFGLALVFTVAGWLPVTLAFVGAATAMRLVGLLSLREIYESIDWPIIVLLGALIPVGAALESTGGAQSIADLLLRVGSGAPPVVSLVILLVGAMTLSDVINNAAAAVLMAPIAFKVAVGLDASPDPFLICVAVGCSCAFLTPIGHQSNTLVLAPGGYRFGDYARMGLPLEILVVLVATPLIQFFWPL